MLISREIIVQFRFELPARYHSRPGNAKTKPKIIKNLPSMMNVGSWDGN
jgi:hypothetical protein